MKHDRRGGPDGHRLSKLIRGSREAEFVRDTGSRIKSFVTRKPVLSACFGLAAGFVLGMLLRRRD